MANTIAQTTRKVQRYSLKFWGVIACLLGSFLFLAFQGGKLAYMLFLIILALSLYFALGRFSGIASAAGTRQVSHDGKSHEISAGVSIPIQIHVQLPRVWFYPYIIVKDRLLGHHGDQYDFESTFIPDWKSRGEVRYVTPPLRRGVYRFEDTLCTTEDVFGLFQHHGSLKLNHTFSVYPQTVAIKEWSHFHHLTKGTHHHSTTTKAARETTQINGVRDYVYGDRISRIHWNATARTGTWKSKEFEKETLPKTMLLLDCEKTAYPDAESFELAVSIAASLFRYGLFQELTLGLMTNGKQSAYIEGSRGEFHYKQVMSQLIQVEADGLLGMESALQQHEEALVRGSFYVVISPRIGEGLTKLTRTIQSRQLNACHVWVASTLSPAERERTSERTKRLDIKTYPVSSLAELPVALGGKSL